MDDASRDRAQLGFGFGQTALMTGFVIAHPVLDEPLSAILASKPSPPAGGCPAPAPGPGDRISASGPLQVGDVPTPSARYL